MSELINNMVAEDSLRADLAAARSLAHEYPIKSLLQLINVIWQCDSPSQAIDFLYDHQAVVSGIKSGLTETAASWGDYLKAMTPDFMKDEVDAVLTFLDDHMFAFAIVALVCAGIGIATISTGGVAAFVGAAWTAIAGIGALILDVVAGSLPLTMVAITGRLAALGISGSVVTYLAGMLTNPLDVLRAVAAGTTIRSNIFSDTGPTPDSAPIGMPGADERARVGTGFQPLPVTPEIPVPADVPNPALADVKL